MRTNVLALGGKLRGLSAALAVRHALQGDVDLTVVSANDHVRS